MEHTGERHILNGKFSNKSELYIHLMHIATYEYAKRFVINKKVLDFGCGSGYGTKMLAESAESVTGVDISKEAIDFAGKNYPSSNLDFKTIPNISGEKFDVITSFQVIEHVPNDNKYIDDLKKLLNPGGYLLISTPDKTNRLFNYIQQPWNVFHLKEYTAGSLKSLLQKHFNHVDVLKIGSEADFVLDEINRTKKQKTMTLPCTLSIYPYSLRVFLLKTLTGLFEWKRKLKPGTKKEVTENNPADNFVSKYSHTDIIIEKEMQYSTDLLAVCIKE